MRSYIVESFCSYAIIQLKPLLRAPIGASADVCHRKQALKKTDLLLTSIGLLMCLQFREWPASVLWNE